MQIIASIVIGFFAGLIARFLIPGRDAVGFVLTTVLGIVGAVVAVFIGRAFGFYGPEDSAGFLSSVIGAAIVLWIYNSVSGKQRGRLSASTSSAEDHRRAA